MCAWQKVMRQGRGGGRWVASGAAATAGGMGIAEGVWMGR
jgi:hypothetical protein